MNIKLRDIAWQNAPRSSLKVIADTYITEKMDSCPDDSLDPLIRLLARLYRENKYLMAMLEMERERR